MRDRADPAIGGRKWVASRTKNFGRYEAIKRNSAVFDIGAYHSKNVEDYASLLRKNCYLYAVRDLLLGIGNGEKI